MVLLTLVDGDKGPNDVLVLVKADYESLSLHELFFILKQYFESEDGYYPVSRGNLGRGKLLGAIGCVGTGVPLKTILEKFQVPRKGWKLNVVDKRKTASDKNFERPLEKLHEVMQGP